MAMRAMFFSPSRRQGRFKSLLVDENEYFSLVLITAPSARAEGV
jgi:hypothetical protein